MIEIELTMFSARKLGSQEDAILAETTRWRKASDRDFFVS